MTFTQKHINNLILTAIGFLKSGANKDNIYLSERLNELLPVLKDMKKEGFLFHHTIKAENEIISDWKFDMDDIEELERFIDNYTINEICFNSPKDFNLPEAFDKHSLSEVLLIVKCCV